MRLRPRDAAGFARVSSARRSPRLWRCPLTAALLLPQPERASRHNKSGGPPSPEACCGPPWRRIQWRAWECAPSTRRPTRSPAPALGSAYLPPLFGDVRRLRRVGRRKRANSCVSALPQVSGLGDSAARERPRPSPRVASQGVLSTTPAVHPTPRATSAATSELTGDCRRGRVGPFGGGVAWRRLQPLVRRPP